MDHMRPWLRDLDRRDAISMAQSMHLVGYRDGEDDGSKEVKPR